MWYLYFTALFLSDRPARRIASFARVHLDCTSFRVMYVLPGFLLVTPHPIMIPIPSGDGVEQKEFTKGEPCSLRHTLVPIDAFLECRT